MHGAECWKAGAGVQGPAAGRVAQHLLLSLDLGLDGVEAIQLVDTLLFNLENRAWVQGIRQVYGS